jgi:glycosyltransferase 2 family protein
VSRTLLLVAKVAVSLALLAYLLATTDLTALYHRLRGADGRLLAAAVALYITIVVLSTWRWRVLLQAQGYEAPLRHLSASYLVANFFNNFLPGNIGGDLVRVRDSSRLTGSTTASVAVVAIDRILGFSALYLLAVIAYVTGPERLRRMSGVVPALLLLTVIFSLLAYIYFRPGTARKIMAATGLNRVHWLQEPFDVVQAAVDVYRAQLGAISLAFTTSVALQALVVCYFWAAAHALRIPLTIASCFLVVPLCILAQALPISFNGWGIRESVFVLYFGQLGVPRDSTLAFSLAGAGLMVVLSLVGVVVWTSRAAQPAVQTE